ncbi:3601_t:CDS:10 [Diversispora eburnea]|uniref:E3 ubiquitin-protein ligase listerin n=1 Tax=Diversispora eburnea TaxID=1213867 RepID=A0A9N9AQ82_9GLOM|nr:3601_t:CDS:10 [Diversispora eburnea]
MGKTKNKQRVKGNVQPASSSRAAEIIAASGTQIQTGSFAQLLGESPFSTLNSASTDIVDNTGGSNLDSELVLILKRLSKRDPITKLKALEDLETYLKNKDEDNYLVNVTGNWAKFFVKLAIDVDRRIRFSTFSCHLLIVSKIKKKIAPYLKEIIGIWIISLFDQSKDAAFNTEKHIEVLIFGQTEILSTIFEIIINKTPETLSDPRFISKEDMISKYSRVVTSSYYALAHLIDQIPEDSLSKVVQQYNGLLCNAKFWSNLTDQSALVRKSCYNLIKVLTNKWPKMVEDHLEMLTTIYLMSVLNDKDKSVYEELWNSLLVFTKYFPKSWLLASKRKAMLPKLFNFLRCACHGTVTISYPCILPLISNLPQELIDSDPKFYDEFFSNFWKGLSNPVIDRSNSGVFLQAYIECLMYYIFKLENSDDEKQKQIDLIENKFFKLIEMYLVDFKSSASFRTDQMRFCLGREISRFVLKFPNKDISDRFIQKLRDFIVGIIKSGIIPNSDSKEDKENDFKEFCQKLMDLLFYINSTINNEYKDENNVADNFVSPLVENIFQNVLSQCKEYGCSVGLSLLLSNIARDFSFVVLLKKDTNEELKKFLNITLLENISTIPTTCLDYLFELFSFYLFYIQESSDAIQLWINLVSNFDIKCSFDDNNLNKLLIDLTNKMLYQELEFDLRTKVENLLERALLSKVHILKSQTKIEIINILMKAISACALEFDFDETSTISKDIVFSILQMFSKLFKYEEFTEFFLDSDLIFAIWHIFELTFMKTHEYLDQDVTKNIQEYSQICWNQITDASNSHSRKEVIINNIIHQIKSSLLDIHFIASPTDFALRVTKLCSKFHEGDNAKVHEVIVKLLPDEKKWHELCEPFISVPIDSSFSCIDSMILPIIAENINENKELPSNCHWILLELLLMYVICSDNYRSRRSDHHLWDVSHVVESGYQGFREFLEEKDEDYDQIDNLSGLIEAAVRRANGNHSYWTRVLHILCSKVFEYSDISPKCAEEFFDVVTSESYSLNLTTRIAFILSLRPFVETSENFKDFQNKLIKNICNLESSQIFTLKDNKGWPYICLLNATITKDGNILLPPIRFLDLLESIQRWHDTTGSEPWMASNFIHIQVAIAKLLNFMMPSLKELSLFYWVFIFELVRNWLKNDICLELRYEAVHLSVHLINISSFIDQGSRISNDPRDITYDTRESQNLIEEYRVHNSELYNLLSLLLFQEKVNRYKLLSEQYLEYLDILSSACHHLPTSLLVEKKDEIYPLLLVPHEGIQKCAYKLLHVVIMKKALELSEQIEFSVESVIVQLDNGLLSVITDANNVSNLTDDAHKTFGYLLVWRLVFDQFENITFNYKSQITSHLKELDITSKLFDHIFETLGLVGTSAPYDLSKWDIREFYIEGFEIQLSTQIGFPLLCANLYYKALENIPLVVRSWWSECKKRQISVNVESYTEKYFSPIIIQDQLDMIQSEDVKSRLEDEKFSIRVARSSNEIIASYNIDEYIMELSIRMPNNFPLRQAEFGTLERMGTTNVTDLKWAKLPVQTVVNSQNGNMDMALNLFKNNIKLRFQGVDDCTICYSIVSLDDRSLPSKYCHTFRILPVVHFVEDCSNLRFFKTFVIVTDCN